MKIKEIKLEEEGMHSTYVVTFMPNWLEKIFGVEEKQKKFKDTGEEYLFGGNVYINQDGDQLPNSSSIGRAIDKWNRRW